MEFQDSGTYGKMSQYTSILMLDTCFEKALNHCDKCPQIWAKNLQERRREPGSKIEEPVRQNFLFAEFFIDK